MKLKNNYVFMCNFKISWQNSTFMENGKNMKTSEILQKVVYNKIQTKKVDLDPNQIILHETLVEINLDGIFGDDCCICHDETKPLNFLTHCGHWFHNSCWTQWYINFGKEPPCPTCKNHQPIFSKIFEKQDIKKFKIKGKLWSGLHQEQKTFETKCLMTK